MEDEMNQSPTPRFGNINNKMKLSNDDTVIKQLLKTEKKKHPKYPEIQNREKSKSKNKSPRKEKKSKSSKIKDLNSEEICEEFLRKKFKLRNDFDHEHTENFLFDKEIAMENVELSDEIFE